MEEKRDGNQTLDRLDDVKRAHAQLSARLGRPPTASELARETGMSWGKARVRMKALGLPFYVMGGEEAARLASHPAGGAKKERRFRLIDEERPDPYVTRKRRLTAIYMAEGTEPKHQPAGSEYGMSDLAWVRCACCGAKMTIRPRLHAYWIRRRDGTIAWLCMACSGQYVRGAFDGHMGDR